MTDKEIVERAKDAEKRTRFGELVHSPISKGVNSAFGIGFIEGMVEYRNSLQEEPVSEDLEEAAERYAKEKYIRKNPTALPDRCRGCYAPLIYAFKAGAKWQEEQMEKNRLAHCDALTAEQAQIEFDFVVQHLKKNNRTPTFIDAIEYGMRLQKEQMMANTADAMIGLPYENKDGGYTHLIDVSRPLPIGNNKIAIIFKED